MAAKKVTSKSNEPKESVKELVVQVAKERGISKESVVEALREMQKTACKTEFGKTTEVRIDITEDNYELSAYLIKEIVECQEDIDDPNEQIALEDAKMIDPAAEVGGKVDCVIDLKNLRRVSVSNGVNVFKQKLREAEKKELYNQFHARENDITTGKILRKVGKGWSVNIGSVDALLTDAEMTEGEDYKVDMRLKVLILNVEEKSRGPVVTVSRKRRELVKCLFEQEVAEIADGTVEIKSIAREPGSRTKMAVYSHNDSVDPVGSCVGVNGARVNAIVHELRGEKIDIVPWDENPGTFIKNALSPAQIVNVFADPDEKEAKVIVPDDQLSLAIGKVGQNARLAAKLTNYKIDIKSESQAMETDEWGWKIEDYYDDEEDYEEEYSEEEVVDEDNE